MDPIIARCIISLVFLFSRVKENWAMRVHSIKDRLDSVIHKLADKNAKSKDDGDLEKSLIGEEPAFSFRNILCIFCFR